MSYSPNLSSSLNKTNMRDPKFNSPCSGMCTLCVGECSGTCEIGLSAVRGADTVYPNIPGEIQYASAKDYPVDYSHFTINGRVFGALGAPEDSDLATVYHVNTETTIGKTHPVPLALPIILPALAKLNWRDYFGGAAMAGVLTVIGESVVDKDSNLVVENGKVTSCPLLHEMFDSFQKYYRGYGQIILQANLDDELRGVLDYGVKEVGFKGIEIKFGQAAKGIQAMGLIGSLEEALKQKHNGNLVLPDPEDPKVQENYKNRMGKPFRLYNRLPMWTEEYLVKRLDEYRAMGAENVYFKMTCYDPQDMEKVLRMAAKCDVDMITFDGAGGGSGGSPIKMMNEWGVPTVAMESVLYGIMERLTKEGIVLPQIAITGGLSTEDHVFKVLSMGAPYVQVVGLCRSAMAAAFAGRTVGQMIAAGNVPKEYAKYGSTVQEIFADLPELRAMYGEEADEFAPGAIGVYSYLNRIGLGLSQFMALNRKFALDYVDRSDILPLTRDAKDLMDGKWLQ